MHTRKFIIVFVALIALANPAPADLVLLFLDSPFQPPQTGTGTFPNIINNFIPLGDQPFVHDNFVDPAVSVPAVSALNNPFAAPGADQAGSITLLAGQKRIIQVALLDSLIGNTFPPLNPNPGPASSIPPQGIFTNPRWLSSAFGTDGQFGMKLWETRITGTVIGPTSNPTGGAFIPPPNAIPGVDFDWGNTRIALTNPNAAFINLGSMPPAFSDFGGFLATGRGAMPNRNYGSNTNQPELGGRIALFNFEITTVATDPGGTYPITITDRGALNDIEVAAEYGIQGYERIGLDLVIFSAAHPTYVLNVTVIPVPEPSSIVLVGMALAGLGYKIGRKLIIALIAFLALAVPARADLVLLFLDSPYQDPSSGMGVFPNQINNFIPLGNQPFIHDDGVNPPVSVPAVAALNDPFALPGLGQAGSITLQAGQKRIIQVALLDSIIGNTFPPIPGGNPSANPASSIPPTGVYTNPRWLRSIAGEPGPQSFGLTLWETRITGTVVGPTNNPTGGAFVAPPNPVPGVDAYQGNNRLSLTHPGAAFVSAGGMPPIFSDFGGLLATGNGATLNRNYGDDVNQPQLGGQFSLFNFEITTVASDPGGTYPITVSDRSIFNDFEVRATGAGGIGIAGDRIALDSVIFSAAHPTYTLNVTVTPVPEPTSMILVGMALAGLGYKIGRKVIVALIALMALANPARADLVLLFLDSPFQPPQTGTGTFPNIINNFIPLGDQPFVHDNGFDPPVSVPAVSALNNPFAPVGPAQAGSITLQAGQKRIIQVALLDSIIGNVFPPIPNGDPNANPASSIPPMGSATNPRWLANASGNPFVPQAFGLRHWKTRITSTVVGSPSNPDGGAYIAPPNAIPGVDADWGNSRISLTHPSAAFINSGSMPPLFSDFGGLLATGSGAIPNRNYGQDASQPQLGGRFSLFNFEITTVMTDPGGVYPLTISDLGAPDDFEAFGQVIITSTGDRIPLDSVIFSAAHPTYTLNVTVIPVPEPSNIALVGIVVAGCGYRLRRRRIAIAIGDSTEGQ